MNKLNHVAFIMDGNGRWGRKKEKEEISDILKGVETVKKIVKSSIKLKIPILLFMFFLQKIGNDQKRNNFLFKLIKNYFSKEIKNVITRN